MKPAVSVLLPTRNGERRLTPAIESVLGQTYRDFELIVVNDGSSDGTARLLDFVAKDEPRLRVIDLTASAGLQRALNTGLENARGSLVARIDDDDLWIDPEKLALQVAAMEDRESLQLVGTGCEIYDPATGARFVRAQPTTDREIRNTLLSWNPFVHSSVMFRREAAALSGGYDEALRHSEDHDLWLKLGRRGTFANLRQVCVEYRLSTSVASFSKRLRSASEQLLLLRRHGRHYPGAGSATLTAVGRFALHLLPLGHGARSRLRARRRR